MKTKIYNSVISNVLWEWYLIGSMEVRIYKERNLPYLLAARISLINQQFVPNHR